MSHLKHIVVVGTTRELQLEGLRAGLAQAALDIQFTKSAKRA